MTDLTRFPITERWPAQHPDRIQLYSFPTPNGIKVAAMLEESELPYEPHLVQFGRDDQHTPEFLSLNPNGKIPAILDPAGPGGQPLGLFESGAILVYLAEKSGRFLPTDPAGRYEALAWLMWQMGGVGPLFGQFGYFFKMAGKEIEDRRPYQRYRDESRRLIGVLNERLRDRAFVAGDEYTIADMAIWPWLRGMIEFYKAGEIMEMDRYPEATRWLETCAGRPASQRALTIPDPRA